MLESNGISEVGSGDSRSDGHFGNGHHSPDYGGEKMYHGKTKVATKLQQRVHVTRKFNFLNYFLNLTENFSAGDLIYGSDQRKKSAKSSSPNFSRPRSRPTEDHQPYDYAFDRDDNINRFTQDGAPRKHNPLSDLCAPLDHHLMSTDFDFEGNLAKFEKLPRRPDKAKAAITSTAKQAAMLDQLLHGLSSTPTRAASAGSPHAKNIRHDENIVDDPSRIYVNAKRSWRYLTG